MIDIVRFDGPNRFLSNFYLARVRFEERNYPSVEHAYQAAKTVDPVTRMVFEERGFDGDNELTAVDAKRRGRGLPLRPNWEGLKLDIMEQLLREKFQRHVDLRFKLIATGSAMLIEGNWWGDRFWGVYRDEGQNHLGRLLMQIRAECVALKAGA